MGAGDMLEACVWQEPESSSFDTPPACTASTSTCRPCTSDQHGKESLEGEHAREAANFQTVAGESTEVSEISSISSNTCTNFDMPSPSESGSSSPVLDVADSAEDKVVLQLDLSPRTSSEQPGSPRDSEFGLADWQLGMEALLDNRHLDKKGIACDMGDVEQMKALQAELAYWKEKTVNVMLASKLNTRAARQSLMFLWRAFNAWHSQLESQATVASTKSSLRRLPPCPMSSAVKLHGIPELTHVPILST